MPDALRAWRMVEIARMLKPDIAARVRAHTDEEVPTLQKEGIVHVFIGKHELALAMTRQVLEQVADRTGTRVAEGRHDDR